MIGERLCLFARTTALTILALLLLLCLIACYWPRSVATDGPTAEDLDSSVSYPQAVIVPTPRATSYLEQVTARDPSDVPGTQPHTVVPSVAEIAARASDSLEYSFMSTMISQGQITSAQNYVKQTRMRQELIAEGQAAILLLDISDKVAYLLVQGESIAMKMDFSAVASHVETPGHYDHVLPADASFVGVEAIHGREAVVFEVKHVPGTHRVWICAEMGLALRIEGNTDAGQIVLEFFDYRFGLQPDRLFELPPDTVIIEVPISVTDAERTP